MARAYCTLDEVKRVLRTAARKVRTSEAYRNLDYDRSNSGSVRLTGVTFLDTYAGSERFEVTFSDSTNYEVIGEETGFLGIGVTQLDFLCEYFTIASSQWQGTPVAGDRVSLISSSNISVEDATAFVDGVSKWVNNKLGIPYADSTNIPWEADISVPIPDPLNYAAIYRSAYEIFSAVFAGAELDETPVDRWNYMAGETIDKYIKWYEEEGVESAPRWMSRDIFFTELGVDGVGKGEMEVTADATRDTKYTR